MALADDDVVESVHPVRNNSVVVVENFQPKLDQRGGLLEPEDYEREYDISPFTGGMETESFLVPTESVLVRMGAKSQLREWLVRNFPPCHTYVEPFGGSFKVLLWKPYRNRIEIINDIDQDMVHFFHYVVYDPERLVNAVNALPCHEAINLGFRQDLKHGRLSGLERAVAFYVVHASTFNGLIDGGYGRYKCSPSARIDVTIDLKRVMALHRRLQGVSIRSTNFERILEYTNGSGKDRKVLSFDAYKPLNFRGPITPYHKSSTFFYLDPPYWATAGYKTVQGKSTFGWPEQVRLAEWCYEIHQTGNLFIETNSDHEDLRKLYGGFKNPDGSPCFTIERREVYYSVAGKAESREEAGEFVISNFPLAKQRDDNRKQRGLFA